MATIGSFTRDENGALGPVLKPVLIGWRHEEEAGRATGGSKALAAAGLLPLRVWGTAA